MTYDELLAKINDKFEYCSCEGWGNNCWADDNKPWIILRAVVELHRPAWASDGDMCLTCSKILNVTSFEMTVQQAKYPCSTIQAIEKELT